MQSENALLIRRLLIILLVWVGGAFLLVTFILFVYHFLTTGKIVVNTGNKYSSITVVNGDGTIAKPGFSKSGKGSLTVSVRDGQYFVAIKNQSDETDQYVKVSGRSVVRLNINASQATGTEPVAYGNFTNI